MSLANFDTSPQINSIWGFEKINYYSEWRDLKIILLYSSRLFIEMWRGGDVNHTPIKKQHKHKHCFLCTMSQIIQIFHWIDLYGGWKPCDYVKKPGFGDHTASWLDWLRLWYFFRCLQIFPKWFEGDLKKTSNFSRLQKKPPQRDRARVTCLVSKAHNIGQCNGKQLENKIMWNNSQKGIICKENPTWAVHLGRFLWPMNLGNNRHFEIVWSFVKTFKAESPRCGGGGGTFETTKNLEARRKFDERETNEWWT